MKRVHVHYGSWKSASTLVQMTLRKNKQRLFENGAFFADQQEENHKEFARKFRSAFLAYKEKGLGSTDVDDQCRDAANLFEHLSCSPGAETVVHSWENFVGHPFSHTQRTLYHGVFTAWWFDEYLSHLPLDFTFITRNQADLIEAMYTQEVRKGRFLGSMDDFLGKFVKGRDLSWLPVIEPFVMRFGGSNVRVIPFEQIKQVGSEAFLKNFFDAIFDFEIELTVNHSNPSFSGKAVEIALKNYPHLNEDQRKKEEVRLVREYSNLKYPRSDFLGQKRRAFLLESVAYENEICFDKFVSPDLKNNLDFYKGFKNYEVGEGGVNWLDAFYKSSNKAKSGQFHLININESRKEIPFVEVEPELKSLFPENISGKSMLVSGWAFNYALPKGSAVSVRATIAGPDKIGSQQDACLYFVELIDDQVGAIHSITQKLGDSTKLVKGDARVRYAAILVSNGSFAKLKTLRVKVQPVREQCLPTHINFDSEGFYPSRNGEALLGYSRPVESIPYKISSFESLSLSCSEGIGREVLRKDPKLFFLTIDVESFYFKRPTMMTGEGLKNAKSCYEILNEIDRNNLKAVFYVNVYEHLQYGDDSVERLCKTIHERGHEVALHSHKAPQLSFYGKEIVHYDYDGQRRILEYGKELIHKWLNYEVVNYRAGGYLQNDTTLLALQSLGFKIDSSYFYRHNGSEAHKGHFVEPYKIGSLLEVPVLYLPLVMPNGTISDRKFDINAINLAELKSVAQSGADEINVLSYMMHSFSFIDRKRFEKNQNPSNLLLRSPPLNSKGRYMGVTGLNEKLWRDFCSFLEFISTNSSLEVALMRDKVEVLNDLVSRKKRCQKVPVLYR